MFASVRNKLAAIITGLSLGCATSGSPKINIDLDGPDPVHNNDFQLPKLSREERNRIIAGCPEEILKKADAQFWKEKAALGSDQSPTPKTGQRWHSKKELREESRRRATGQDIIERKMHDVGLWMEKGVRTHLPTPSQAEYQARACQAAEEKKKKTN
jgi:hypothetical protein